MKHKKQNHHSKRSQNNTSKKVKIDLFGMHAVREAFLNPKRHVHEIYLTESARDGFQDALNQAQKEGLKRPSPQIIEKSVLDNSCPPGSVHQGIALNCQDLEELSIEDIIRAEDAKEKSVLIMLDQVTDPHNVGAIIRSACAFGAAALILQSKHAPALKGVLAKTACGAAEHLPVIYETNLTRTLEKLQDAGYFVYGLDERGHETIDQCSMAPKTVLALGAEGDGLRRLVREQCDQLVRLPTQEPILSLNVSNAAAVALYACKGK
ncbi:MAG: 23S rRNA (guanosine(2251)-2'-O)-methyltransferase RlmB [Pseudomonadota bacterium]